MTESDWLKAKDPDEMLELVQSRFSARRWQLLACAHIRRLQDILPPGSLRELLDWAELHAGTAHSHPDSQAKRNSIEPAARLAADLTRDKQRLIVLAADPDSDPEQYQTNETRRTNPSALLFQQACRHAVDSIQEAVDSTTHAATALQALLSLRPGLEMLQTVREEVTTATRIRANANILATSALKLKTQADEFADQQASKKANLRYATAQNMVTEESEQVSNKLGDQQEHKHKADRKALGKFLLELSGNPFKPYRFEAPWRSETVVGLARGIYHDRAFDRMPILADALLDADCDEEAILRHCRGTELHATEAVAHIRGCWVLELILEHEVDFFQHAPLTAKSVPAPARPNGLGGNNWARLLEALQRDDLIGPDDEE